jgi:hypothetical protein
MTGSLDFDGVVTGRGVDLGVAAGFDHGQRVCGRGVGFGFEAAGTSGATARRASNDSETENFMNGSNRREQEAAQSGPGFPFSRKQRGIFFPCVGSNATTR